MLSAFVVAQLVFDVAVVALAAVYLLTKRPPVAPEPPEWYSHFLKLAQDLMAATEPVLEKLESRNLPANATTGSNGPNESANVSAAAGAGWDAARLRGGSSGDWRTRGREAASQSEFGAAEADYLGGSGRPPSPPTLQARNESGPSANALVDARYERARMMLRAGERPEAVAGHIGLTAAEMRLLTRVVAAETRPRSH